MLNISHLLKVCLLAILPLWSGVTIAATLQWQGAQQESVAITDFLERSVIESPLGINATLAQLEALEFIPISRKRISPYEASDWFRFTIHNASKQEQQLVINFNQIANQRVDVIYGKGGNDSDLQVGEQLTTADRYLDSRINVVPLLVPAGAEYIIYLRFENLTPLNIDTTIESEHTFLSTMRDFDVYHAVILSVLVALFLSALLTSVVTGSTYEYRWYLCFVLLSITTVALINGYWYKLPQIESALAYRLYTTIIPMGTIFQCLFIVNLFDLKDKSLRWYRTIFSILLFYTLVVFSNLFLSPGTILMFISGATLLLVWVFVVAAGYFYYRRFAASRYFALATVSHMVMLFVSLLGVMDILPLIPVVKDAFQYGACMQVFFFSLAIIDKLQNYRQLNEQLIDKAELARQENTAKTSFLATMSHEIRTPMTGILGISELLGESLEDKVHREYNSIIHSSASALLNLLNDVLDFSKIEAGRMQLESIPFNLEEEAFSCMQIFAPKTRDKRLRLIFDYDPDIPSWYQGDPTRIKQILINLVSNGCKFTEQGYIRMKVRREGDYVVLSIIDTGIGLSEDAFDLVFEEFTQADSTVTREYGGTGLGLSICRQMAELMGGFIKVARSETSGTVFTLSLPLEPTSDHNTKHQFDFSERSILLYSEDKISRSLLEAQLAPTACKIQTVDELEDIHGPADILVAEIFDLEKNENAIFKFASHNHLYVLLINAALQSPGEVLQSLVVGSLIEPYNRRALLAPLEDFFNRGFSRSKNTKPVETFQSSKPRSFNILVADDNHVNRIVISKMLEREGHKVNLVNDGQQAVDFMKGALQDKHRVDLIFMDCDMPVMDGLAATREIRLLEAKAGHEEHTIIALTAHAMKDFLTVCLNAGMNDYLTKPITRDQLSQTICRNGGLDLLGTGS